jgi:hypothetical protein
VTNSYNNSAKNLIYNRNWSSTAYFQLKNLSLVDTSIFTDSNIINSPFSNFAQNKDLINTAILSVNTPQINSHPIEEWVGGQWVYTNGRQEIRQIEITFRDTETFGLWRNFVYIYDFMQNRFPNEMQWNLALQTIAMEIANSLKAGDEDNTKLYTTLVETKNAILSAISPISFSQEHAESFATFTVTFKYYIANKTNENPPSSSTTQGTITNRI